MSHHTMRSILDKMDNEDPDYRYMATSDLLKYLNKNTLVSYDSETQRHLCKAVIKLLSDSSSEVQGMAQKCLPSLTRFVDTRNAVFVVDKLMGYVMHSADPSDTGKSSGAETSGNSKSLRDVAALGLKSIVNELPTGKAMAPAPSIAENMLPLLLQAIPKAHEASSADLQIEALELLHVLLARLSPLFTAHHEAIAYMVVSQVWSSPPVACKRAVACLAALAPVCSHDVLAKTIASLTEQLDPTAPRDRTRRSVQALWAISKAAGRRIGPDISRLAPKLLYFLSVSTFEDDDELREHCLHTLQSFVEQCPRVMDVNIDSFIKTVVKLAKYDPNYESDDLDDNDQHDDMLEDAEDDGQENIYMDDDDEDEFSDDDDMSWKVRRAAVKCISASIAVQLKSVPELYTDFAGLLVSRFGEREESVKLDVFEAYKALLRQVIAFGTQSQSLGMSTAIDYNSLAPDTITPATTELSVPWMQESSSRIVRSLRKVLRGRSVKTRTSAMVLLRELVLVPSVELDTVISKTIHDIYRGLVDTSAQMKAESIMVLRNVVDRGGVESLRNHLGEIIPRVLATGDDRYYKITAESLRLCSSIISACGSQDNLEGFACVGSGAVMIHDSALRRLVAQDQDSKVKEAALECISITVPMYAEFLGNERRSAIGRILCERLNNDVTRLATVRALIHIAQSKEADVLIPHLQSMTAIVTSFLRKSNPSLRLAALDFLVSSPTISAENDALLLRNICELISDTDLRMTSLCLRLVAQLLRVRGHAICSLVAEEGGLYVRVLSLLVSPLLQGRALNALLDFFGSLAMVNSPSLCVDFMIQSIRSKAMEVLASSCSGVSRVGTVGSLVPVQSASKCVAEICRVGPPTAWSAYAKSCISDIGSMSGSTRIFALMCVGELGRRSLLGNDEFGKSQAQAAILGAVDVSEEDVKTAAAVALGGLASGDGATGIPTLIDLIRMRPDIRYLLLLSLRDAIAFSNPDDVSSFSGVLLQVLQENTLDHSNARDSFEGLHDASGVDLDANRGSGEESVRIATAECLGLLARVNPEQVLPALKLGVSSDSRSQRSSVMAAIKYLVSAGTTDLPFNPALDSALRMHIGAFLSLANDPTVMVRKNAMQTVNAIARFKPVLLVPHLPILLPLVYKATFKDQELVRKVDLGPFKYEEDFGLDLRKSAFDCMRTIISGPLSPLISLPQYLERVVQGLVDVPDVRATSQLILGSVVRIPSGPTAILSIMDKIVDALSHSLSERLKENAVRQEKERHDDSLKAALRTVRVLENNTDIAQNAVFASFMDKTIRTERLAEKYEEMIRKEAESHTDITSKFGETDSMDE